MRTARRLVAISLPMGLLGVTLLAQENNGKPEITSEVKHDVSPPMWQLRVPPRSDVPRERPLRTVPLGPSSNQPDPVLQIASGPQVLATGGLSFAGVGNGDYGFRPNAAPPDTNGAVGATQYVQWVNESFAVFDKTTGAIHSGFPKPGNTLWSGFGGGCETNNDGDPIVQYDKQANRWVLTQFSVSTVPYLQCVAVSTSSDAAGSYNRYAFSYGNTEFPDYPKLGVWPDAYYISFNIFNNGVSFGGAKVCAYDRAKMLAGSAATQQCFQLSSSFGGLLPSDLDGPNLPPPGSPNFFLNFGNNSLNLWKFHVDWAIPANTTLTGPANIAVATFTAACNGGTCIPQSGTTQKLDSLADRLMYRLAYRRFADHDALVVNHSVATGSGNVGVRWYELRNPAGTPLVYQQGTFAPDSSYRWMGSVAMDQSGNIALGYSISSSGMHPAIGFTGRAATDLVGTMQTENVIVSGAGSQTGGLSRWGDYSAMTVDPVDDCTFWYTNEYLKTNGSFNWSTWISSFKLPGCGTTPSPDFSLSATPASQSVIQGGSTTYTVSVNPSNGYSSQVNLSVTGQPAGATVGFSPSAIPPGTTSTLSVNTGNAVPGTYTLTITGADNTLTHTTSVTLIINAPVSSDFSISASPSVAVVKKGGTATYGITVTPSGGFNSSVVLTLAGLPTGANFNFNPTSVTGSGTSSLTVSGSTTPGTYSLTITGTGGGASHSTGVTLKIH